MAGYYPDVPANRFAYHLDGTKAYLRSADNSLAELSTAQLTTLNDEDTTAVAFQGTNSVLFIFPEKRNLQAHFISRQVYDGITPTTTEVSVDTTNGLDGTWNAIENPWTWVDDAVVPDYRQNIHPVAPGLIKAVRFNYSVRYSGNVRAIHLYGTVPPTENPDRLIFWDSSQDIAAKDSIMDWGDISRGTQEVKQLRLKNNSSTKVANNISVTSAATSYTMTVEFSTDGATYSSTIAIPTLASGEVSAKLYVRRAVPAGEPLRVQAACVRATAASWS